MKTKVGSFVIKNLLPELQIETLTSNEAVALFSHENAWLTEMMGPELDTWFGHMHPTEIRWAGFFTQQESGGPIISVQIGVLYFNREYLIRALWVSHDETQQERVHEMLPLMMAEYMAHVLTECQRRVQS